MSITFDLRQIAINKIEIKKKKKKKVGGFGQ